MAVHRMWRMKRHLSKAAEEITGKRAKNLESNLKLLKDIFVESTDIAYRNLFNRARMTVIFVDSLVDGRKLYCDFMKLLMNPYFGRSETVTGPKLNQEHANWVKTVDTLQNLLALLFSGFSIVLIDGCSTAIATEIAGGEKRSIQESTSQAVIRGLKDGFTERIMPPLSLIRRHIKSLKLASKTQKIEGITQTDVAVVYLKGVAQDSLAHEVLRRLGDNDTDSLLVLKQQVKKQIAAPPGQADQSKGEKYESN